MVWPAVAAAVASVAANEFMSGSKGRAPSIEETTPPEFRGLRQPISDAIQRMMQPGGMQGATGPFAVGLTGGEQATLGRIGQQMTGTPAGTQQAQQTLQQTAQGNFLDPSSNPFLQSSIEAAQRPIVDMFRNEVVPGLRADFTQAGQQVQGEGSSPFQDAAGKAAVGFANALGDVSTNIVSQNFQAERQRQLDAASQLPGLDRAELDRMLAGLEAQALPRMVEQLGLDRGLQEFQRQQQQLMQILALGAQSASSQPMMLPGVAPQEGLAQSGARAFLNAAATQMAQGG